MSTSLWRLGQRVASGAALVCVASAALWSSACVPTDDPPKDDFKPFDPDMRADQGQSADMRPKADMGQLDAGPDAGPRPDMDQPDMRLPDQGLPDMRLPDMAQPGVCQPNRDGRITRAEVPLRAGLSAKYRVATSAPVSTRGEDAGQGRRSWELSEQLAGDRLMLVEAQDPTGRWFSQEYPEATYTTRLSESSDLLGVFKLTPEALLLLGVVSPGEGLTRTRLKYDPPVAVLSFPVEPDKTWSSDARVSGLASGVFASYSEKYTSSVDARGVLKTPYGTFDDVMRVRVELERVVGFSTTRTRTYMFVTECFGTVATIVSENNERELEFTTASEVRRLSP